MTEDLAARLLAAIGQRERVAAAASPGPWRTGVGSTYLVDDVVYRPSLGFPTGHHLEQVCNFQYGANAAKDAEHVVANDPQIVLRRCSADRRILERHEVHGDGYSKCTWCGESWPCPDLRDLAVAYDLEVAAGESGHDVIVPFDFIEYDEWRLTGQPPNFPAYDFTTSDPNHIKAIRSLAAKAAENGWTEVHLTRRHVKVERTAWTEDGGDAWRQWGEGDGR